MRRFIFFCAFAWCQWCVAECAQTKYREFSEPDCILTPLGNSLAFRYSPDERDRSNPDNNHYFVTLLASAGFSRTYGPFYRHRNPPELDWENRYFVVLRQGCGSPCWINVILPLDDQTPTREVYFPHGVDTHRNILAYFDRTDAVTFENLLSGEKQDVEVPGVCGAALLLYCVPQIEIRESEFYLEWDQDMGEAGESVGYSVPIEPRMLVVNPASNQSLEPTR